jgi:beta-glucanase (GH16 family)
MADQTGRKIDNKTVVGATRSKPYWFILFLLLCVCVPTRPQRHTSPTSPAPKPHWILTWSDEFNESFGSAPDPAKWVVETGGNGWGNGESEYYTSRHQNVREENGNLVIEAMRERFTEPGGIQRNYTSARLKTQGRFAQQYGRFEARIKVPNGRGLWSAFWLLGDDFPKKGWPACGEIDVMEDVGADPFTVRGSLHGPGYSGGNSLTAAYTLPKGRFSDDFHIFTADWEPESVRFYVDGNLYETKTPADLSNERWVFDHPFFIILNVAVGGGLGGIPDNLGFPQKMLVDYVRVYSRGTAASEPETGPNKSANER